MTVETAAPGYDPALEYDVVLNAVLIVKGTKYLPRDEHIWSGAFLNRIVTESASVIASAVAR